MPDERSVFVDLMSLSKKDDGYVRANEGVPYLESQLCGLLNIELELLQRTIKKCIKYHKMKRLRNGTYFMLSHEVYKLSQRQQRRIEKEMSDETDTMSEKADANNKNNKENKNKNNNKKIKREDFTKEILKTFEEEFELLWKNYHPDGKKNKAYAKKRFIALCKQDKLEDFKKGYRGYAHYLRIIKNKSGFNQRPKYFSTFCTDYEEYIGYEYKPKL